MKAASPIETRRFLKQELNFFRLVQDPIKLGVITRDIGMFKIQLPEKQLVIVAQTANFTYPDGRELQVW